jgi:hypothetical protein
VDHGRPTVDVQTVLEPAEWRALYRQALRLGGFWTRTAALAIAVVVATTVAVALGAPWRPAGEIATALLAGIAAYTASYLWIGPRLSGLGARAAAGAGPTRWRISAESVRADRQGFHLDLSWQDVDRVVITRNLIVLQLDGHSDVLGLPRRSATRLGEDLISQWADDSGAYVLRRRRADNAP